MLNPETRRRIDACRDILVGKVPDPKAQVEQITTALIYKFMDDMDAEAEEAGGKPSFFTGKLKQYSWTKLVSKQLSGADRMDLYTRAITAFASAEHFPKLFRDIFADAFLPYRDTETLNLFVKEVDGFKYEHPEDLGDGYEYLLSILGSQGDAGQFRTPRHIIDFIVDAVDPKASDKILDPACGTAGFLISAYKHIIEKHDGLDGDGKRNSEKRLSKGERERLINNLQGYDISPDMVRISRVNMYLHQFPIPQIVEYDTLTSEERWQDTFDVILANPPFMTPKGGIRPHSKFSLQANRSEVLFSDYIMEHLRPGGRAGFIVPEGIIFQSANAYKELRKRLVDDYGLVAVVSLPAGVFQPYSGVKTSILIIDRALVKERDEVLFVKVTNDGYDLGAQRRSIDKNDLPQALEIIREFRANSKVVLEGHNMALKVLRTKIAASGEYNLSIDRYRETVIRGKQKWPIVKLGEVCEILDSLRRPVKKADRKEGIYPYYGATGIVDYVDKFLFDEKLVLVGEDGAKWDTGDKTAFIAQGKYWVNNHAHIIRPNRELILDELLVQFLNEMDMRHFITGLTVPKLTQEKLRQIEIPLPPISVQQELVAELERLRLMADGARAIITNYKPGIEIDSKWEMRELGEVCDVRDGTHDSPKYVTQNGFPLITSKNIKDGQLDFENVNLISKEDLYKVNQRSGVDDGDIIMPMIGTIGNPIIVKKDREFAIKNVALIKFKENSALDRFFLYYILSSAEFTKSLVDQSSGSTQKFISLGFIRKLNIPLPPLPEQEPIVARLESERAEIDMLKKMVERLEGEIKRKVADIW